MASPRKRLPPAKRPASPYMLYMGEEGAWKMTKLNNDATFIQGEALTYLSDKVHLVRLPRKPKKPAKKFEIQHTASGMLWCGPAAVAAITGACTATVRDLIKKYRRDKSAPITGTNDLEMEYALNRLGYKMEYAYLYGGKRETRPTFSQWLKETKNERVEGLGYLISLAGEKGRGCGHWALILDDEYVCSHTVRWVPLTKAKFKRRRVDGVYVIRRK